MSPVYMLYVLRGQAALLRTTLFPAVSDCANTERSVGPNQCACSLASVITQHLHNIVVQIPYEEERTSLQRGNMRARSRSTESKPTSHQHLHCTMQLPGGKKGRTAPPGWRRARATRMTQTRTLSTTHKIKTKRATYDTRAAAYRPLGTCS